MKDYFEFDILKLLRKFWVVITVIMIFAVVMFSKSRSLAGPGSRLGYAHEVLLILVGVYIFLRGFYLNRKKMLIEDIPTSTIRSAAMGICEVIGSGRQKFPLKSPLTFTECVYYRFLVEEERRGSKGRTYWATVSSGSSILPFYIEDETGKLLVDPAGAEVILPADYRNTDGFAFPRKRYTEWYICPSETIYVLGTLGKATDPAEAHKAKLAERLKEIKEHKGMLEIFDADKNGQLDAKEWDAAVAKVEEILNEEELGGPHIEDDIVISRGETGAEYIISDRSEKELIGRFALAAYGSILLGFTIVIVMLVSLLTRAECLPGKFIIPWEALYRNINF